MNKKSILKELRSFFVLWSSQTVSSLGTAMTEFALIIWVYGQKETASSVTLLTICTFLPTIVFRFLAGAIVDRWDKKRIMLVADFVAACGTLTIFLLYSVSALQIWNLYVIKFAWSIAAFVSYLSAVIMNANLDTVMRTYVPIEMQGRVFSAKDTLQNCTIPLGLFLGGVLADSVFEPFMATTSSLQGMLSIFFGLGKGAGIAVMFFCVGILGTVISLTRLKMPIYKDLNISKNM